MCCIIAENGLDVTQSHKKNVYSRLPGMILVVKSEERWTKRRKGPLVWRGGSTGRSRVSMLCVLLMASWMKDERAEVLHHGVTLARDNMRHSWCSVSLLDGRWCGGIIRVCLQHQCIFSSSFSSLFRSPLLPLSLCLSVLCGVSTVVITLLTDAGLWAMQHLSIPAPLFVLSDAQIPVASCFKNRTMQGRRLGTFYIFSYN